MGREVLDQHGKPLYNDNAYATGVVTPGGLSKSMVQLSASPATAPKPPAKPVSSPPNSNASPETKTPKYTVNSSSGGRKRKKRLTKKRNRRYKR